MFTGIIECLGKIKEVISDQGNIKFNIEAPFLKDIKIDQSIAHNGVCLTVNDIKENFYQVTVISETLLKTNLSSVKEGDLVNLERSMIANGRFDGHVVQGHVDQTAECTSVKDEDGSYKYFFRYEPGKGNITVAKGSICVNGVSLTIVDSFQDGFSVAIIPYTFENTSFKSLRVGDMVNLEFDIIGKYVQRILKGY